MTNDKDEDIYWNLKPIEPFASLPIYPVAEQLSPKRLGLLSVNTFLAANFAELFLYPLDLAKTRVQVERARKSGAPIGNTYRQISNVFQREGLLKLYAGLSAMVARNFLFNSTRLVLYDIFRTQLIYMDERTKTEVLTVPAALASGLVAGCIAQSIATPFDVVKIRMQTESLRAQLGLEPRVHGIFQVLRDIYYHGGLASMWRGVGPSCLRACLLTAGDVGSYDLSKRNLKYYLNLDEGILLRFLSSMCAGLCASVLSNPVDVVKSRIIYQPVDDKGRGLQYKNSIDCVRQLLQQEGPLVFYKGLMPCWVRLGSWSIVFWMTVEKLREWEGQSGF